MVLIFSILRQYWQIAQYKFYCLTIVLSCALGLWLGLKPDYFNKVLLGWVIVTFIGIVCWPWRGLAIWCAITLIVIRALSITSLAFEPGLTQTTAEIAGEIVTVTNYSSSSRIDFKVTNCRNVALLPSCQTIHYLRLYWFAPIAQLAKGQKWHFTVRLRPLYGLHNPHGFRRELWLRSHYLDAQGTIVTWPAPRLLRPAPFSWISWWQTKIQQSLKKVDPELNAWRWLNGWLLGNGEEFNRNDWDLLNNTGTTHLVVVSGLHVGTIYLVVLLLCRHGLARYLQIGRWRQQRWPNYIALMLTTGYVALTGWGAPACRALIMLIIYVLHSQFAARRDYFLAWWLALALLVLFNPWSLLQAGFWLSFLTVAQLLWLWSWYNHCSFCYRSLRTQVCLSLFVEGIIVLVFSRWAISAVFVNLWAIPLVSFILLPLAFIGAFFALWPSLFLQMLAWKLFLLALQFWQLGLVFFANYFAAWQLTETQVIPLSITLITSGILASLPGLTINYRFSLILCCSIAYIYLPIPQKLLKTGEIEIVVYDVGQGLLIEIKTTHHRLLYDSGPYYRDGSSLLGRLWPNQQYFDKVIISHRDLDHRGGVNDLLRLHQVKLWQAPNLASLGLSSSISNSLNFVPCQRGQHWQWDEVDFAFLWPQGNLLEATNLQSCVLAVKSRYGLIWLLGDINAKVEHQLLKDIDRPLTLLQAAHHGSHSGSSRALLIRAQPQHLVYSSGFLNQYRHPASEVIKRAQNFTDFQWNTADHGAMRFLLTGSGIQWYCQQRC